MKWNLLIAATAALLVSASAAAQGACPRERAQNVPGAVTVGVVLTCGGLKFEIPGLQVTTTVGCPLTITVTPEHEIPVPSASETRVRVTGTSPGRLITHTCTTTYLLFVVPVGSECEFVSESNYGSYMRLVTVGCDEVKG